MANTTSEVKWSEETNKYTFIGVNMCLCNLNNKDQSTSGSINYSYVYAANLH